MYGHPIHPSCIWGVRPWYQVVDHWSWTICFRHYNYLPLHSLPSSNVESGTFLGHAYHVRAWHIGKFWLWRVSKFHCEYNSCGPSKHSDAYPTCTSPTWTKTTSRSRRTYPVQFNHVHHNPWYPSLPKSRSLPLIARPGRRESTHHPRAPSPTVYMSPEPLGIFLSAAPPRMCCV